MNKRKFNSTKNKLAQRIYYHEKQGNDDMVKALILEICMLYVNEGIVPQTNFKYYKEWQQMTSIIYGEEEIMENEPEDTIKSLFTTPEIRAIRKLMGNYNIPFSEKCDILINRHGLEEEALMTLFEELGIPTGPTQFEKARFNELKPSRRYLISSAQSGSPVNKVFFNNMKAYAKHIGAEIGIIATRYRNPTSIFNVESDVWDAEVDGYLTAVRQQLHNKLSLVADLKIQATSPNPTSGLDTFEDLRSIIVGSPTVEMRRVSGLPEYAQKDLFSTGTVTQPSFTDTVAGGKAAENHKFGFVIVEIENDDVVHIRNVVADYDGSFSDLIFRIEDEVIYTEDVGTMNWGDMHFAQKEQRVTDAFRGMCTDLGITTSILDDVWDSQSINVHNKRNPIVQHQLMKEGKDDLRKELNQMIEELFWFEDNMEKTIVVASNHDDMLDRAMVEGDWRTNLKNAEVFIELLQLKLSGEAPKGLVPHLIENYFDNIEALGTNDSYIINGIEIALHGHKGPNGSRGSLNSFAKLPIPTIKAHTHSPAIKGNCYQVGISCGMDHGYNEGLTNWGYASVTINKHGARQLLILNKDTLTYTTLY